MQTTGSISGTQLGAGDETPPVLQLFPAKPRGGYNQRHQFGVASCGIIAETAQMVWPSDFLIACETDNAPSQEKHHGDGLRLLVGRNDVCNNDPN